MYLIITVGILLFNEWSKVLLTNTNFLWTNLYLVWVRTSTNITLITCEWIILIKSQQFLDCLNIQIFCTLITSDYSCCLCKCILKCKIRKIEVLVYLQGIYIHLIKWDAFTSNSLNNDIKCPAITSGLLFVLATFNHRISLENLQRKSEIEKRKMHNCSLAGKKNRTIKSENILILKWA